MTNNPTILDILGLSPETQPRPLDGISLLPLIEGGMTERSQPIAFETDRRGDRTPMLALIDNRYKLISRLDDSQDMLFDLIEDPGETKNLVGDEPQVAEAMRKQLTEWRASCETSLRGDDYR